MPHNARSASQTPSTPAPPAGVPAAQATLFYDGACPLCRREARQYRKAAGAERLGFVDIAGPNFDARAYGLDPVAVERSLHVVCADGRVATGIDAFGEIWRVLPRYRWLVPVVRFAPLRPLLKLGYAVFARIRPRLPGRTCPAPQGARR